MADNVTYVTINDLEPASDAQITDGGLIETAIDNGLTYLPRKATFAQMANYVLNRYESAEGSAIKSRLDALTDLIGDSAMGTTATTITGAIAEHSNKIGNNSIVGIGDNTLTGAIAALAALTSIIGDTQITEIGDGTLTGAVSSMNAEMATAHDGAGYHNSVFRGKYLGGNVTSEQMTAIDDGSFDDLYIGDYWTIGGVNYRIAAFDYYLNTGQTNDSRTTAHHITLVPDTTIGSTTQMYSTRTTANGYSGSLVNSAMAALVANGGALKSAFGNRLLAIDQYFSSQTQNNRVSANTWQSATAFAMTEQNVYGTTIFSAPSGYNGTTFKIATNQTLDKSQYPLFRLAPQYQFCVGQTYWLRNVGSDTTFSTAANTGVAHVSFAEGGFGLRPAFNITGNGELHTVTYTYPDTFDLSQSDVGVTIDLEDAEWFDLISSGTTMTITWSASSGANGVHVNKGTPLTNGYVGWFAYAYDGASTFTITPTASMPSFAESTVRIDSSYYG